MSVGTIHRTRVQEVLERVRVRMALRPAMRRAAMNKPWSRFEDFVQLVGFDLDDWQVEAATSTAQHVMLNCSRQAGKSTASALVLAHTALTEPGTTQIITSPGERQAKELLDKVSRAIAAALAGRSIAAMADEKPESDTATQILMKNGARILALPGTGKTIRTYTVRRLVIDEAAFTEEQLIASVRPMLAVSRGQMMSLSTPNGQQGWWYKDWTGDGDAPDPDIHRIEVPWQRVPRIDTSFILKEKAALGALFAQEYECRFLEARLAVFRERDIARVVDPDVLAWSDL